jgi:hypothetical protein
VSAVRVYLGWRRLEASLSVIADLASGIGLNIEEGYDAGLALVDAPLSALWRLDASAGYWEYGRRWGAGWDGMDDHGGKLSVAVRRSEGLRLYGQIGTRARNDDAISSSSCIAWLAGATLADAGADHALHVLVEHRRYGSAFNLGFYQPNFFFYRDAIGSVVGRQWYPLSVYDRPFSQWAVATEYQGRDVRLSTLRCELARRLVGRLWCETDLDLNAVAAEGETTFIYPFYEAGVAWRLQPGVAFHWTWTNRGMNLDRHYPTLYLFEHPGPLLSATWSVQL